MSKKLWEWGGQKRKFSVSAINAVSGTSLQIVPAAPSPHRIGNGNSRKFPLPILCGDGEGGTICKVVPLCAINVQSGTSLQICMLIPLILSIADSMQRWCRRNNLQARTALCVDCTNGGFAFLASPYPQLLAHM